MSSAALRSLKPGVFLAHAEHVLDDVDEFAGVVLVLDGDAEVDDAVGFGGGDLVAGGKRPLMARSMTPGMRRLG